MERRHGCTALATARGAGTIYNMYLADQRCRSDSNETQDCDARVAED